VAVLDAGAGDSYSEGQEITMRPYRMLAVLLSACVWASCAGDASGPEEQPLPPAGPNWSVPPIPLDKLAAITVLGTNNKALPNNGTYWRTCDVGWFMPSTRPCVREHLPVRAPADGVVTGVGHTADGYISLDAPAGLSVTFGHVTPTPGLQMGDHVQAGDVVATMFFDYSVDVTVYNLGLTPHQFVNPARMPLPYRYAQSAFEQFPEPTRSELVDRVSTLSDPLGRLSWDQAGTAAGAWFLEGTPVDRSMEGTYFPNHLFLGWLGERWETRIMTVGTLWPGAQNLMTVIDPADPSWEAITPTTGVVALTGWGFEADGTPNYAFPHGTVLLEVLSGERLRIEWFDTHAPVTAFTSAARMYER